MDKGVAQRPGMFGFTSAITCLAWRAAVRVQSTPTPRLSYPYLSGGDTWERNDIDKDAPAAGTGSIDGKEDRRCSRRASSLIALRTLLPVNMALPRKMRLVFRGQRIRCFRRSAGCIISTSWSSRRSLQQRLDETLGISAAGANVNCVPERTALTDPAADVLFASLFVSSFILRHLILK